MRYSILAVLLNEYYFGNDTEYRYSIIGCSVGGRIPGTEMTQLGFTLIGDYWEINNIQAYIVGGYYNKRQLRRLHSIQI